MMHSGKKVELLAPAGSFDAMRAAVNAGADAVYMGGAHFGARAYADNPDEDGMVKAIEFCHLHGKKLYMTVNTLFKEEELFEQLEAFLKPYYEAGLDAVIVQDAGAVRFISEHFPGLDIHLSTQCTITMAEGAEYLRKTDGNAEVQGCGNPEGQDKVGACTEKNSVTRVVPARELSLKELQELRKNTALEIEVFIHGALCYCYSGQCLLSSMAGGRSGNRGRCAQPCRRMYINSSNGGKGYYLSPKDMCALPHIHKMIEAGIDSFKIEGRMKSPEYVAGVVSVYREYIDRYYEMGAEKYAAWIAGEGAAELEKSIDLLRELYNRGGFNEGYLFEHNGSEMMSMKRPNHSGVRVGTVTKCEGRKAYIKLERAAGKGDVLEIRTASEKGEKALYEFTLGEDYSQGVLFSVLTMKERTAVPGLEVYRTKNSSLLDLINEKYIKNDSRVPVDIRFRAAAGEAVELCFTAVGNSMKNDNEQAQEVCITGNPAESAQKAPTSEEDIRKQLQKLGNTPFAAREINISLSGNLFIPVGELNRLRREAAEQLESLMVENYYRRNTSSFEPGTADAKRASLENTEPDLNSATVSFSGEKEIAVLVSDMYQLKEVLNHDITDCVYFDISDYDYINNIAFFEEIAARCSEAGKKVYFALPAILRSNRAEAVRKFIRHFERETSFLARNREELEMLKTADCRKDYHIYAMNSMASALSGGGYTLPLELNEGEIRALAARDSELIIYGLLPVMYSAQCVYKNTTGKCLRTEKTGTGMTFSERRNHGKVVTLTDEKGYCFTSEQICGDCYNIIYNSSVLNLIHRYDSISTIGVSRLRLNFTGETASETRLVLDCLEQVISGGRYILPEEMLGLKFTNGHFCRGVE